MHLFNLFESTIFILKNLSIWSKYMLDYFSETVVKIYIKIIT